MIFVFIVFNSRHAIREYNIHKTLNHHVSSNVLYSTKIKVDIHDSLDYGRADKEINQWCALEKHGKSISGHHFFLCSVELLSTEKFGALFFMWYVLEHPLSEC